MDIRYNSKRWFRYTLLVGALLSALMLAPSIARAVPTPVNKSHNACGCAAWLNVFATHGGAQRMELGFQLDGVSALDRARMQDAVNKAEKADSNYDAGNSTKWCSDNHLISKICKALAACAIAGVLTYEQEKHRGKDTTTALLDSVDNCTKAAVAFLIIG